MARPLPGAQGVRRRDLGHHPREEALKHIREVVELVVAELREDGAAVLECKTPSPALALANPDHQPADPSALDDPLAVVEAAEEVPQPDN